MFVATRLLRCGPEVLFDVSVNSDRWNIADAPIADPMRSGSALAGSSGREG
jgi:hypothetical protein